MIKLFKSRKMSALLFIGINVLIFLVLLGLATMGVAVVNVLTNRLQVEVYTITFFALMAFSLLLALGVTIIFYIMAKKAQILIDGLSAVASGDYAKEIHYRRGDPFTVVYKNFNKMTSEIRSVKTMREDFVRNFSHEIKTPLFSIQGFANLLSEGGLTEEEERKFLKVISDEAGRLVKLADNTLILSKLENQQLAGESQLIKLDSEIAECIILLERDWEDKKIDISTDLQPLKIKGDASMLRQVWINLISNAIKFSPEGGKIEINLKREGNFAVATVRDYGCGISEEELPKIFDKYYRSPTAKDTEGNGLGLAICKRICTLSGGSISAASAVGEGAEFKVSLPLQ